MPDARPEFDPDLSLNSAIAVVLLEMLRDADNGDAPEGEDPDAYTEPLGHYADRIEALARQRLQRVPATALANLTPAGVGALLDVVNAHLGLQGGRLSEPGFRERVAGVKAVLERALRTNLAAEDAARPRTLEDAKDAGAANATDALTMTNGLGETVTTRPVDEDSEAWQRADSDLVEDTRIDGTSVLIPGGDFLENARDELDAQQVSPNRHQIVSLLASHMSVAAEPLGARLTAREALAPAVDELFRRFAVVPR